MTKRFLKETIERRVTAEGYRIFRELTKYVSRNRRIPPDLDEKLTELIVSAALFGMSAAVADLQKLFEDDGVLAFAFENEIFENIPVEVYERISNFLRRGAENLTIKESNRIHYALQFALNEILGQRISFREGVAVVRRRLMEVGAAANKFYAVETLLVTAIHAGYNEFTAQLIKNPDIWARIWGFRYKTKADEKVRYNHAQQHNVTLPKDDLFWVLWWPPNGYNCRCGIEVLLSPAPIKQPDREVVPDPGFEGTGPILNMGDLYFSEENHGIEFGFCNCSLCG